MKKTLFSLILILLANFFATNLPCCGEDFFLDTNFIESKNKIEIPSNKNQTISNATKKNNSSSKETKKTRFNYATNKEEDIPKGYYGTLPDIEADFQYKKQSSPTSSEVQINIPENGEIIEENLKPAPFDDSLFLDQIIKKEKNSQYVNDLQKIKLALLNLKNSIEEEADIQRFNSCVNMLELYVQNFNTKYSDKTESFKESYAEIINTNYYAKLLGNLKYDSNYYARYIPTNQGKYSKDNISLEEEKLLNRINKTLLLIYSES